MQSMTGYGKATVQQGEWELCIELRSVNHRFLDLSFRLPRGMSFMEDMLRKTLAPLKRGHVDVSMTLQQMNGAGGMVTVDTALAQAYMNAAKELEQVTGVANDMTVTSLMQLDGVTTVTEAALDEDALLLQGQNVAEQAMTQLVTMRTLEGERMRDDLLVHLDASAALREKIAERAPAVVDDYRQRLTERLAKLPIEPVDPARLAQEVALMADKCAVDEELSRLNSHIAQMRCYLDASGEVGKKMDFLIQEMNREANTIGSKCSDAAMAQCVVDLKSEIEKLREQIQNVV
jgi:uncharacterized protein (TIGR00255 family)